MNPLGASRSIRWVKRAAQGGVSRILLGSLVGQGSLLVVSPLLTRLYSPADFASLAVVTAVSAVLGSVVTLSWERAIVIPVEDARARAVVTLGIVSVALISVMMSIVAFAARHPIADLLGSDVFVDYWWLVPLTVAAMGVYSVASTRLVRAQNYGALGVRNGVLGLSQAISSVTFGLLNVIPLGLISSVAVGRIAALVGLLRPTRRHSDSPLDQRSPLWETAKMYAKFPLVNTWSRVLNSLGLQLPVILIVALFGSVEAGLYALTLRVLASPVGVVTDAVSQYFEGVFARRYRHQEGGLVRLMTTLSLRLAAVGAIPAAVVVVWGPALFGWVFGDEWESAGVYARILVVAYLAQLIVSPISRGLVILQRQGTQLAWDASRLAATSLAVVLAAMLELDFLHCALLLAAAQIVWYALLLGLSLRAARRVERRMPSA